jgi:hypothetical protein
MATATHCAATRVRLKPWEDGTHVGEARAQIGDLSLIAHEVRVALLEVIVRERRQSGGRRYVAAGRVDSRAALPVLGKIPGHEKLGSIGMRRILEDRLREID